MQDFHHPNEDIQRWWRYRLFEEVAKTAKHPGLLQYAIFDADETLLAQGVTGDEVDATTNVAGKKWGMSRYGIGELSLFYG